MKLFQYLYDWIDQRELEGRITARSAAQYRMSVTRHIWRRLMDMDINAFGVEEARAFQTHLVNNSLLSMSSVKGVIARLKTMLDSAVHDGLMVSNPLHEVRLGRGRYGTARVMSTDQLIQLLEHVKTHRLAPIFHLALSTGLARRELVDLRWADVDLKNRRLALTRRDRLRWLPLPEAMLAELRSMRLHAALLAGARGMDEDELGQVHVFKTTKGEPWRVNGIGKTLQLIFEAAGLEGYSLQDLRHSHMVALMQSKRSTKEVSEAMGHTQPSVTRSALANLRRHI